MAAGPALLFWLVAAGSRLAAAAMDGTCHAYDMSSCRNVGGHHVFLQLADQKRLSKASGPDSSQDQEACHTAEPGEQCYAAIDWAMNFGILNHPEWYPKNLTKWSTKAMFQEFLMRGARDDCPLPCNLCHTAEPGEECHTATTWAMEHGIRQHPEWYIGLVYGASFEEFQAHLHLGGLVVNGKPHAGCPMPCNLCRTVSEASEPCYTDIEWAMKHGINLHPEWYPGLNKQSSREEFQGFLNTQGTCPPPCGLCHTAEEGERCYQGVEWAKTHGIKKNPGWYPDLNESSTFEEFQLHLHQGHYEQCPRPCGM